MKREPEDPVPAGNVALDFLNTARLARGRPVDDLRTPRDVVRWLERAGLLDDDRLEAEVASPAARRVLLTEAQRLRVEIGRVVEAFRAGKRPPASARYGLGRVLEASRVAARLGEAPGGALVLIETERGVGPLAPLAPVALAAARLLSQEDPRRVRRCASRRCRTWFLDTSKGSRRRWCSMARCGNRAKAAKHRRRLSTGA